MEKKDQQQQERFYWNLAFIIFLLFIASIIALYSGQTQATVPGNYVLQQVVWYIIGSLIVAMAMFLEPDQYKKLAWVFYAVGVLSLIALHFAPESIAPVTKGAKSWFKIPKVGSIQPSEFMKVFLILGLSRLIADHNEKYARIKNVKTDFWLLIKIGLVAIVPLALIAMRVGYGDSFDHRRHHPRHDPHLGDYLENPCPRFFGYYLTRWSGLHDHPLFPRIA